MAGKPRRRITLPGLLLILMAGAILFLTIAPVREILNQRAEIDQLGSQLNVIKKRNEQLRVETQRLNTDAYIEKQARERLGLIKPGEEPYVIVPPAQQAPAPAQTAKPAQPVLKSKPKPVSKPWYQQIADYFSSLFN